MFTNNNPRPIEVRHYYAEGEIEGFKTEIGERMIALSEVDAKLAKARNEHKEESDPLKADVTLLTSKIKRGWCNVTKQASPEWSLDRDEVVFYCIETGDELDRRSLTIEERADLRQLQLPLNHAKTPLGDAHQLLPGNLKTL